MKITVVKPNKINMLRNATVEIFSIFPGNQENINNLQTMPKTWSG